MPHIIVNFAIIQKQKCNLRLQKKKVKLEAYEKDLVLNDTKLTGIKEKSVWDEVLHCRSVENYAVCYMHDV